MRCNDIILSMKKLFTFILLSVISTQVFAIDLDESVDDEIRQNYKSNQLVEESLPELPKILQQKQKQEVLPDTSGVIEKKIAPTVYRGSIKSGTKFAVVNDNAISDGLRKGTRVTFHTKALTTAKGVTIPAGTKFYAEVEDSHLPQLSCNGGLVVLSVHSIVIDNSVTQIDGYITRANSKKIFLNNIKGKRTYLKTMWKKTGLGRNLFNRMLTLTVNLAGDGPTLLLSPFPLCYGTVVLGLNTLTSPLFALFSKGGRVNIPTGTDFVIKLREDVNLYY